MKHSSFPSKSAGKGRASQGNAVSPVWVGPAIPAIYGHLVRDFGGCDAAAVFLGIAKGTISKQIAGDAAIAAQHFGPLEDALERWPITDLLAGRAAREDLQGDPLAMVRSASAEVADLGAVFLDLVTQRWDDPDVSQRARAELAEASAAINRLLEHLEAEVSE